MLARRSLSSRSSVELNVEITDATSALAAGSSRRPGSRMSTMDISSESRRSGRRLMRTSQAFATSITSSPPMSTTSWPRVGWGSIAIGVTMSSRTATNRIAAFTANTRQ